MCYRFCTCTTITVFVVVVFVEFSIAENMNLFAIICSVLFIAILIIALIIVLSMKRQSAKYYTHEDKLGMINRILRICYIDFARVLCVHVTRHTGCLHEALHLILCCATNIVNFADGLYEKNLDSLSINGNELSYKHNIDDIIYTIDELALPHSMSPTHSAKSTTLSTFITRNG